MGNVARRLGVALADVFFPRECFSCGRGVEGERRLDLCEGCAAALRLPEGRYCVKCGAAMAEYASKCPNCHNMRIRMKESRAYGGYEGALREALIAYKFEGRMDMARSFGEMAARTAREAWGEVRLDAVVGLPLHRLRRRERGFDQSDEIARRCASGLGVRYAGGILKRVRATESQVGLSKTARMKNVSGAFSAKAREGVKRILLVDDIMTTGATASEAARALLRAGAREVYVVTVARAGMENAGEGGQGLSSETKGARV